RASCSRPSRYSESGPMSTTSFGSPTRRAILVIAVLAVSARAVSTQRPHFYPDDPIAREPESQDASNARPYQLGSLYEMANNLFVTSGYTLSGTRAEHQHHRRSAGFELVHEPDWIDHGHRRGSRARPQSRSAARPLALGRLQREDVGRPSGLHREGRERRDLVSRVRSPVLRGRGDRSRRSRDKDFLGTRLLPGGIVPDDLRSEAGRVRPQRHASPPVRSADEVHAR